MMEFEVPLGCDHCIHQVETLNIGNAFSVSHFDRTIPDSESPKYPKRLIFRLANTCNLACVMCDGETSSRIRRDRDKEAPFPAFYDDEFYEDLEEVLANVEHLEFYGGEPFLVREHRRIFELLMKLKAKCTIFINTNCMALNAFAKKSLRNLNVSAIVISMDAYHAEVHENVRYGLRSDLFFKNAEYLLALRQRKNFTLAINTTEHRKNWFDLPNVFRWAEANDMNVHVNHCVHPVNVTLYTLPSDELTYVCEYWEAEKKSIKADFPKFRNEHNYEYMISLVKGELAKPKRVGAAPDGPINPQSDGFLEAPIPSLAPFDSPDRMLKEIERICSLNLPTRSYMVEKICKHLKEKQLEGNWHQVASKAKQLKKTICSQM